jgi:ArsR family transcriptional regulator
MSMNARARTAVRVAKALADETRFRLLKAIAAREEISCAELTQGFPLAQATVSHHLRVLAEAGLVAVRRSGQFHHYRARPEALAAHGALLAATFAPPSLTTRRPRGRRARPPVKQPSP